MALVRFWGNSFAQLQSLPPPVRAAFARAILSLETDPTAPPQSEADDLISEPLRGEEGLFRISVGSSRNPPGYRAIYYVNARTVHFIRFRYRDPSTYRGLRRDLGRLRHDLFEL